MVEGAGYCAGGPPKDPRYVVTHCGDCDDWHVVAYAIISSINKDHGVEARYFLTMVPGHAFLTVYYPEEGKWELYDWFPPIGIVTSENGEPKEVVLDGRSCHTVSNFSLAECVVKIKQFENFGAMNYFYSIMGYLRSPFQYLFELPNLRYVTGDYLHCLESGRKCSIE